MSSTLALACSSNPAAMGLASHGVFNTDNIVSLSKLRQDLSPVTVITYNTFVSPSVQLCSLMSCLEALISQSAMRMHLDRATCILCTNRCMPHKGAPSCHAIWILGLTAVTC